MAPHLPGGVANVTSRDVKQYAQRMVTTTGRGGLHLRHSGAGTLLREQASLESMLNRQAVLLSAGSPKPCATKRDASSMRSDLAHRDEALLGDGSRTINGERSATRFVNAGV